MTLLDYDAMELDELRKYVLTHREDMNAFEAYIDRSKAAGRMITIEPNNSKWEEELSKRLTSHHHPQEQDYWQEEVEVETSTGQTFHLQTYLLRVYPETFNHLDAYMDIPLAIEPSIQKVYSPRLEKTWVVIAEPTQSPINGLFRGNYFENNPPAWMFGLKLLNEG